MRLARKPPPRREAPDRRSVAEVLGVTNSASPYGSTRYKRIRRCPREHGFVSVLGLRPERSPIEELDVGLIFHYALEKFYKYVRQHQLKLDAQQAPRDDAYFHGAQQDAEVAAMQFIAPLSGEEGYEETFAEVQTMLGHYFHTYRRQDRWRVVAVEETLTFRNAAFQYSARLDLVVEDFDRGGLWIVEHKSARAITDDLLQSYELDLQIVGQCWLLHQCVDLAALPPFRGVLVDIMTKSKKYPRLERHPVSPNGFHLDNFARQLVHWREVEQLWEQQGWPQALGNCSGAPRYFRQCAYYDICRTRPERTFHELAEEYAEVGPPLGFELVDLKERPA